MEGNEMFQRIFGVPVIKSMLVPKDQIIIGTVSLEAIANAPSPEEIQEENMDKEPRIKDLEESGVIPPPEMKTGGVKAASPRGYAVQIDAGTSGHVYMAPLGSVYRWVPSIEDAAAFNSPSAAMRAYGKWYSKEQFDGLHKLVRVREVMERTVEVVR